MPAPWPNVWHFGPARFSIHQTLRLTPATEAGITDHVWTIEEMLDKVGLK
jgi:hypothetical protein